MPGTGGRPASSGPASRGPDQNWRAFLRSQAGAPEDRADRSRSDADPELSKLALDADAPPPSVLPSQPKDQGPDLGADRGPAGPALPPVGPLPSDQLSVPPEQRLRPHEEQAPPLTGDGPAGRGKHRPIKAP